MLLWKIMVSILLGVCWLFSREVVFLTYNSSLCHPIQQGTGRSFWYYNWPVGTSWVWIILDSLMKWSPLARKLETLLWKTMKFTLNIYWLKTNLVKWFAFSKATTTNASYLQYDTQGYTQSAVDVKIWYVGAMGNGQGCRNAGCRSCGKELECFTM